MKKYFIHIFFLLGAIFLLATEVSAAAQITIDDAIWHSGDGSVRDKSTIFPGASLTRYYAPHAVFFEGWQSSPREDIVDYTWDFGDGTASKKGFNSAHVYEQPGTYTATLTVTYSDKSSSQDSVVIEVLARDGVTYYVDSSIGSDNYDGRCQTVQGSCGPWKTADKAFLGMENDSYGPGDQILFKRGQVFAISRQYNLGHWPEHGYMFSDYGSGAKPVIQYTGTATDHLIYHGLGFGYVSFVDLEFRFRNENGGHSGGLVYNAAGSQQLLFLRVDAYDPLNGFFILQGHGGDYPSTNSFLVDSTIRNIKVYPESTTLLAYWGSRLAMINNYFDNSGNHIAYTSQDKGVVIDNHFSRPAFGRTALRIHGNSFEHPSNNVYVADNYFQGWIDPLTEGGAHNGGGDRYNALLVQFAPNVVEEQAIENITFERNVLTNAETFLYIATSDGIKVRNNIFLTNNDASITGGGVPVIRVGNASGWDLKPSRNIEITGNTIVGKPHSYYNALNQSAVVSIHNFDTNYAHPYSYSNHENIRINNNIFYTYGGDQWSRFIQIADNQSLIDQVDLNHNLYYVSSGSSDGQYFYIGSNNEAESQKYNLAGWKAMGKDAGSIYADPLFVDVFGSDGIFSAFEFDADLSIGAESPATSKGYLEYIDSFYDYELKRRYSSDNLVDIGAFEIGTGTQVDIIRADVDQNTRIDTSDALLTMRKSLDLTMTGTAWRESPSTGDVNCDGVVTSSDALLLLRYSAGLNMSGTGWCE